MIVSMMEDLLGWTEFETSLFFCGAGIDVSRSVAMFQRLLYICIFVLQYITHLYIIQLCCVAYYLFCCPDACNQED